MPKVAKKSWTKIKETYLHPNYYEGPPVSLAATLLSLLWTIRAVFAWKILRLVKRPRAYQNALTCFTMSV